MSYEDFIQGMDLDPDLDLDLSSDANDDQLVSSGKCLRLHAKLFKKQELGVAPYGWLR